MYSIRGRDTAAMVLSKAQTAVNMFSMKSSLTLVPKIIKLKTYSLKKIVLINILLLSENYVFKYKILGYAKNYN